MYPTTFTRPPLQNDSASHEDKGTAQRNRSEERAGTATCELVLIRGLPGSGKSTMARALVSKGFLHFEADMFFEVEGVYQYDAARIRDAHKWCQSMARQALAAGKRVVVSNTFTLLREMDPYAAMTRNLKVVEAIGKWQNVHGVPHATLKQMAQRWEAMPS
jgi:chloramphenicol 3-O-phosphotransferase